MGRGARNVASHGPPPLAYGLAGPRGLGAKGEAVPALAMCAESSAPLSNSPALDGRQTKLSALCKAHLTQVRTLSRVPRP